MRNFSRVLSIILVLVLSLTPLAANAKPASAPVIGTPTGYNSADDVRYVTATVSGRKVVANWGSRGEVCVFLSKYVDDYYTDGYDVLASYTGGTTFSNVSSSQLYKELQNLMTDSHSFYTYYDGNKNVRNFYKYTDCMNSDTSKVSLLYRGTTVSSQWDAGSTWNQEHVWPQSYLGGDSKKIGDIMHLRPSNPSENSSRGNKAYGTGSGQYDPGVSVRGDCARMVLYMSVRWNENLSEVMQNLDTLLKWMEEDPVDTWEMGRNDAVQSVTGVRNVFVDYPELAWELFSQTAPKNMTTPSGKASNPGSSTTPPAPTCEHTSTELRNQKAVSCTEDGYTGDSYCKSCGKKLKTGTAIPATGHVDADHNSECDYCGLRDECAHEKTAVTGHREATCTVAGYTGYTVCEDCQDILTMGEVIPVVEHKDVNGDAACDVCSKEMETKPTEKPTEPGEAEDEGDGESGLDPMLFVWIGVAVAVVGVAVIVIVVVSKKKK
ncbi:MAG: hypothetical protein E7439_07405 [Ruminococcaceae bacterium]|nr:hypothetical protein [Oscillospiraceae bacterium]